MLWDKSTVYEPNASDEERICSARRERCEQVRRGQRQASSGQRKSRVARSSFDFDVLRNGAHGVTRPTKYGAFHAHW